MTGKTVRTAPDPNQKGWPSGIPYIIGNEGCERFSYYGMKSILQVYLTALILQAAVGGLDETVAGKEASSIIHTFGAAVYAVPMIGAILADRLLGKYRTILWLSIIYCLGHLALAVFEDTLEGIYLGLGLIAIGSGGIKPCVSAHVGDQFGRSNWHLVKKVYEAFYFIINFGSFFASLLIPFIKEHWGVSWAFGIPGILMGLATLFFWLGRHSFVHVPAQPGGKLGLLDFASGTSLFLGVAGAYVLAGDQPWYVVAGTLLGLGALGIGLFAWRQRIEQDDGFLAIMFYATRQLLSRKADEAKRAAIVAGGGTPPPSAPGAGIADHWFFGPAARRFGAEAAEGPLAVLKIVSVFFLVMFFWALFDQHGSTWITQAQMMDLTVSLPIVGTFELLPSQLQALNPLLVMILIPFTSVVLYPALSKLGLDMTPLRRMTLGMFVAALSFVAVALIQARIDAGLASGDKVGVLWQFVPYLVITIAEVMVSVTGLEFAYTQAPRRMKSTIMGFWLLFVAMGNLLVAELVKVEGLPLVDFFWLFAGLMAGAAVLFGVRAAFYKYKDYSQG